MAFELLRTDYADAVFEGLRRYLVHENEDGSVSFFDITKYEVKEKVFFGAKDANAINTAVNAILAALENGTDLYEVFTQFFELQKTLFQNESDAKQEGFEKYISNLRRYMDGKWDELKNEYTGDIQYFKDIQENAFNVWFQMIRNQLSDDAAGNLQNQINVTALRLEDIEEILFTGIMVAKIETDEGDYLTDELGNPLFADWPICKSDDVRDELAAGISSLRQQSETEDSGLRDEINSLRQQSETKDSELLDELYGQSEQVYNMLQSDITGVNSRSESRDSEISLQLDRLREHTEETEVDFLEKIRQLQDRCNEVFQSVSEGKEKIASAFADVGVNMDAAASFDAMAARIRTLEHAPGKVSNVSFSILPAEIEGYTSYRIAFGTSETIERVDLMLGKTVVKNIEPGHIVTVSPGEKTNIYYFISYSASGATDVLEGTF